MKVSRADYEKLRILWAHGVSADKIANALHVRTGTFINFVYNHRKDFPKRKRETTDDDIENIVVMRLEGKTIKEISEELGMCESAVARIAHKKGLGGRLPKRKEPRLRVDRRNKRAYVSDEDYDMLLGMWREGASAEDMAEAIGSTPYRVELFMRFNRKDFPIESNAVTDEEKGTIRRLSAEGMRAEDIAERVGRCASTVRKVLREGSITPRQCSEILSWLS